MRKSGPFASGIIMYCQLAALRLLEDFAHQAIMAGQQSASDFEHVSAHGQELKVRGKPVSGVPHARRRRLWAAHQPEQRSPHLGMAQCRHGGRLSAQLPCDCHAPCLQLRPGEALTSMWEQLRSTCSTVAIRVAHPAQLDRSGLIGLCMARLTAMAQRVFPPSRQDAHMAPQWAPIDLLDVHKSYGTLYTWMLNT